MSWTQQASRCRLAALLAALSLAVAAMLGGVFHPTTASAATRGAVAHLMDVNGASVADRSDHHGDHDNHDSHKGDGDHDHHGDSKGHESDGHHDDHGDHHGAECHNCGVDNGDHHSDEHGGSDEDHHHHGGDDDHDRGGLAGFLREGAEALAHLLGGGHD